MTRTFLRFATVALAFVCGFTSLHAQSPVASLRPVAQSNRVPANADLGPQTQLTGHIPSWVSNGTPVAQSVNLSANMELTIVLQRDPAVQAAFTQFLADQQTPGNPLYHQWLTPQQVGTLFGPTASDLAAVTSWLTAQGLTVDEVQPNQVLINVHGTTAAVGSAFHTSFGYFPLNGQARISAVNEPFVPTALSPVVNVVFGLTDLPLYPNSIRTAPHQSTFATNPGSTTPVAQPNYNSSSGTHYMSPGDFAIVYDSVSVLAGGNKGAGANAHVAVIGRSRVATTDISEFAANMGIGSSYTLNTIIPTNGTDPGPVCTFANANTCTTGGDQGEQTLDVDRVVGNAPNATVDLIVATSLGTALQWNVNTVKDPIMTISYGGCEAQAGGPNAALTYDTYYSTAAAEGISTFVSSGDSDANGCALAFTAVSTVSAYGPSPNYLCSSSYVTCVGGTEFIDSPAATYWSSTNTTASNGMVGSVLSYMPEGAWNEPGTAAPFQTAGTGGGASLAIGKPTWQTGTGTLADGHRDTPDVAYPAAQHDSYYACLDFQLGSYTSQGIVSTNNCTAAGGGYFFGFAGTSAAAPAMAGVTALLNTKLGTAQGNLNPQLYTLAATTSNGVFHDVTVASSGVTGCLVTVPSVCNNSTPGSSALSTAATGGMQGFLVTAGWDEATGLGSIDVAKFLTAATPTTISTTLAVTATTSPISAGQSDTFTATLTRSSGTAAATGTVQFYNNGVAFGSAVTISNNVAVSGAQAFPSTGTYAITAVYSGDTNYTTSTSPAFSLVVNAAPSFSVTPASATYSLISGVTTGNTDLITFASVNSFVGGVTATCSVTNVSGTAAGTCAMAPGSVTLTSGGTGTSTLTITTTPGTSGVLSVTVTGTNGTTVVNSSAITVNLTASSYTMSAAPLAINITSGATTGNTSTITLTSVNGFAGTVTVTCVATKTSGTAAGSCAASPSTVTLAANGTGTTTVTLTSTAGTAGVLSLAVSGSGAPTGGTIAATASIPTPITATLVTPSFTMAAPATISLAGNATTGNTLSVTLTSQNGFAGLVTVGCASTLTTLTNCSGGTATLTAGGTATATVTVSPVLHNSGSTTLTVSGTGTSTGLTTAFTATPVAVTATITTVASATTLVAAPTTVVSGSPTTLTATVTGTNGTPTGSVTFFANGSQVAVGTLTGAGVATTTYTPTAPAASVSLTATYAGDSGYNASTSASTTIAVIGFSASAATPTSITVTSGATTGNTAQFTFTPVGAFTGTVALTCSVSTGTATYPPTCVMAPTSISLSPGAPQIATLTITTTTPKANRSGPQQALLMKTGGAVFALLVCLVPFRRRRFIRPLMAVIFLMGALTAISGCGGSSAPVLHGSAGTYTVTVTGTSGTATANTTVPLQVN